MLHIWLRLITNNINKMNKMILMVCITRGELMSFRYRYRNLRYREDDPRGNVTEQIWYVDKGILR